MEIFLKLKQNQELNGPQLTYLLKQQRSTENIIFIPIFKKQNLIHSKIYLN